MFPTVRPDVAGDTESPVELAATVGRSGINIQRLPSWWPILLREATDIALNRVILNADEPVEQKTFPSSTTTTSAASCPPPARPRT